MEHLGGLTAEEFLRLHWQKQPLLVREAFPHFDGPVTPELLAGLACTDAAESRLILERDGVRPWEQRSGPFSAADFERLPESHWTLLVQGVDRVVPEVERLLGHFRFIPNWRLDDVMVSYAVRGGGVGPHVDRYDVFLLQGLGRRRWQVRREPVEREDWIPGLDIRVLRDFDPDREWVLEPGDMLYLPPRVAHCGTALENCMTYSIGFRAPGQVELAAGLLGSVVEAGDPERRYEDPDLEPSIRPGEIDRDALRRAQRLIDELLLQDESRRIRWFGRMVTEPRRGELDAVPRRVSTAELEQAVREGAGLRRCGLPCFAYTRADRSGTVLFVCGEAFELDQALEFAAPLLCDPPSLTAQVLEPHLSRSGFLRLLTALVNKGYLLVDPAGRVSPRPGDDSR